MFFENICKVYSLFLNIVSLIHVFVDRPRRTVCRQCPDYTGSVPATSAGDSLLTYLLTYLVTLQLFFMAKYFCTGGDLLEYLKVLFIRTLDEKIIFLIVILNCFQC